VEDTRPIVNLYEFDGLGLILEFPSGVLYSNQVAGYGCYQREIEGIMVPLPVRPGRTALNALENHFRGGWNNLTEQDAQVVDGIFRTEGYDFLGVDRARLNDSYEAWVHVRIQVKNQDRDLDLIYGFKTDRGVVTWPNSD